MVPAHQILLQNGFVSTCTYHCYNYCGPTMHVVHIIIQFYHLPPLYSERGVVKITDCSAISEANDLLDEVCSVSTVDLTCKTGLLQYTLYLCIRSH